MTKKITSSTYHHLNLDNHNQPQWDINHYSLPSIKLDESMTYNKNHANNDSFPLNVSFSDYSFFRKSSSNNDNDNSAIVSRNTIIPFLVGIFTFQATSSCSTWAQHNLLRVSTGTIKPIPSLLGAGTVMIASMTSHLASIKSYQMIKGDTFNRRNNGDTFLSKILPPFSFDTTPSTVSHCFRVCTLGLLTFTFLFQGKFWSISPSSYTYLGSFSNPRGWIHAKSANYITESQRKMLNKYGRRYGCHTCGNRQFFY